MILKVTFQKESPKQSLLKVSSEAAVRKGSFPIFTGKRLCCSLSLIKLQLCLKETSTQVFSCEYCEILKQFFHRTPLVASVDLLFLIKKKMWDGSY